MNHVTKLIGLTSGGAAFTIMGSGCHYYQKRRALYNRCLEINCAASDAWKNTFLYSIHPGEQEGRTKRIMDREKEFLIREYEKHEDFKQKNIYCRLFGCQKKDVDSFLKENGIQN